MIELSELEEGDFYASHSVSVGVSGIHSLLTLNETKDCFKMHNRCSNEIFQIHFLRKGIVLGPLDFKNSTKLHSSTCSYLSDAY